MESWVDYTLTNEHTQVKFTLVCFFSWCCSLSQGHCIIVNRKCVCAGVDDALGSFSPYSSVSFTLPLLCFWYDHSQSPPPPPLWWSLRLLSCSSSFLPLPPPPKHIMGQTTCHRSRYLKPVDLPLTKGLSVTEGPNTQTTSKETFSQVKNYSWEILDKGLCAENEIHTYTFSWKKSFL